MTVSSQRALGLVLRDEGIELVRSHSQRWAEDYIAFIQSYASTHREFTGEDVRAAWLSGGGEHPHHHNAYGAAVNIAARRELIVSTNRFRTARSPATHGHPVRIWRRARR